MVQLRKVGPEEVAKNATLLDYPVEFEGTLEECANYARERDWEWVHKPQQLYKGYWVDQHTPDRIAYIPT